jgi:3'-5' exonuclease
MQNIRTESLLFIDIQTVPQQPAFELLPEDWQALWTEKVRWQLPPEHTAASYYPVRAGIMAEFARVICVSLGYFRWEGSHQQLRIKSFYEAEEAPLLRAVLAALKEMETYNRRWCFTGHNIKEFDIPFLCRRLLANGLDIPPYLDFQNMKPWEVNVLDTFQYWRFGDYRNYTSLKLLAATLGIPPLVNELESSMVADAYYHQNGLTNVVEHCQQDIITVANVVRRLKHQALLGEEDVVVVG